VNKANSVNIAGGIEAAALRVLRRLPELTVLAEPTSMRGDATVRVAGKTTRVSIEFKRRVNAATAWQLVHRTASTRRRPLLLVADETTADARKILEEHGIAAVDGLGNAHIKLPGLLLHLEGRPKTRTTHPTKPENLPPARLRGKASVIAQLLLLRPQHHWQITPLAAEAGVSPTLAHRILTRLEREGVVTSEGRGPNRFRGLSDPAALLDLWVEEEREDPTPAFGYLLAQTPRQLISALAENLASKEILYAMTGAAAASLLAPIVTAIPIVSIWVQANVSNAALFGAARAEPVTDGQNCIFLQANDDAPLAFRELVGDIWVVNRFRLYADLRADPRRGVEQANHFRHEVIGF
jgi:hypothetical protein